MDLIILCSVTFVICVLAGWWLVRKPTHQKTQPQQDRKETTLVEPKSTENVQETKEAKGDGGKNKKKKKAASKEEMTVEVVSGPSEPQTDETFLGHLKTPGILAIDFKLSRILVSSPNRQLTLFDMKHYVKDNPGNCKRGYVMLQSEATAVAIGEHHYYVALDYDKTIAQYEFIGTNGVYFRLVQKFKNKYLHKDSILAMHVPENEQFIVTVGSMSDTSIKVWSLKGERLFQLNTSQVEHYSAQFGQGFLWLRSWTPEIKLYQIAVSKDGQFQKLERSTELSHSDGALAAAVDQKGEHAISLRKDRTIQLWKTDLKMHSSKMKKIVDHVGFGHGELSCCAIHTLENDNGHLVTLAALSDGKNLVVCDGDSLQVLRSIMNPYAGKDTIESIRFTGKKSVVMYTYSQKAGKIMMWNVTNLTKTH